MSYNHIVGYFRLERTNLCRILRKIGDSTGQRPAEDQLWDNVCAEALSASGLYNEALFHPTEVDALYESQSAVEDILWHNSRERSRAVLQMEESYFREALVLQLAAIKKLATSQPFPTPQLKLAAIWPAQHLITWSGVGSAC